jgi:hypothetical protein
MVWRIQLKALMISRQNLVFNLFSVPIFIVMIYTLPLRSMVRFGVSNGEAMLCIFFINGNNKVLESCIRFFGGQVYPVYKHDPVFRLAERPRSRITDT